MYYLLYCIHLNYFNVIVAHLHLCLIASDSFEVEKINVINQQISADNFAKLDQQLIIFSCNLYSSCACNSVKDDINQIVIDTR